MGKKKGKNEKKGKGAEKTITKTEKNAQKKAKKQMKEQGEVSIFNFMIYQIYGGILTLPFYRHPPRAHAQSR